MALTLRPASIVAGVGVPGAAGSNVTSLPPASTAAQRPADGQPTVKRPSLSIVHRRGAPGRFRAERHLLTAAVDSRALAHRRTGDAFQAGAVDRGGDGGTRGGRVERDLLTALIDGDAAPGGRAGNAFRVAAVDRDRGRQRRAGRRREQQPRQQADDQAICVPHAAPGRRSRRRSQSPPCGPYEKQTPNLATRCGPPPCQRALHPLQASLHSASLPRERRVPDQMSGNGGPRLLGRIHGRAV